MKRLVILFFSSILFCSASFAASKVDVPNTFYINEHWVSLTTSFDIETKTQRLGTLYRKFFSLLLAYEFYDPQGYLLATAQSRFFSFTAHFDVYDNNKRLLGSANESLFSFFPSFDIWSKDGVTKLAKANMNFWGTTFTITDPVTNKEIATMSRSFFRIKNDWTFKITNRELFDKKQIDTRVLMTVIAFQGDREYWEKQDDDDDNLRKMAAKSSNSDNEQALNKEENKEETIAQISTLLEKVNALNSEKALVSRQKEMDKATVETVANELEAGYNATLAPDAPQQSTSEHLNGFVDYCLTMAQDSATPESKKEVIQYLLKMRLESGLH